MEDLSLGRTAALMPECAVKDCPWTERSDNDDLQDQPERHRGILNCVCRLSFYHRVSPLTEFGEVCSYLQNTVHCFSFSARMADTA